MRIKTILVALVAALVSGCEEPSSTLKMTHPSETKKEQVLESDQNLLFDNFANQFLLDMWGSYPDYGIYVGYYENDEELVVPDASARAGQKAFLSNALKNLQQFDLKQLSADNATDFFLIQNQLESSLWYLDVFKLHQWNPANYNVAGVFGLILNTDYKPLDDRLETIFKRLDKVPPYYAAAIENIQEPTLEHTILAIQQNKGALGVFEKLIPASLQKSSLSDERKSLFSGKLEAATKAIKDYVGWLEKQKEKLADGRARDFRIGEVLYEQKFKHDIVSNYSARELYEHAIAAKEKLHQEMIAITKQLWPKYFKAQLMPKDPLLAVKQLIEHLAVKHVRRDEFVDEVKRQVPIIQQFIDQKDLLDTDPTRPLVVRETPEYQRGIAGASVNAPGPYDATANTYYNVTPLDAYNEEQAESYLREYNHWILQILNIHEAVPGHYTQLMHANKSPSKIKSIFGNGAMIEGWAVYSERMMLEEGYGNNEPELWLMYNKWNLRVVVNTILDYSVQVLGMTEQDALNLLMNEAFQERTEAEGKWRRATLSQVQLTSYYNGYAEIYAFREELKKKLGDKFNLKDFHNHFLSYGSTPVPVIRRLMLNEFDLGTD